MPNSAPASRQPPTAKDQEELTEALSQLRDTVRRLPREYGYFLSPGKHLVFTYLKGVVYGLGALTAVAIVTPLLVTFFQHIQWVPLVGDFVQKVSVQIEQSQRR